MTNDQKIIISKLAEQLFVAYKSQDNVTASSELAKKAFWDATIFNQIEIEFARPTNNLNNERLSNEQLAGLPTGI